MYQVTHKNGERFSAAKAYLVPNLQRPNLQVITDAFSGRGSDLAKPNGNALNQLRTDEAALAYPWQTSGGRLFQAVIGGLILSQLAEYGLQIVFFRRGA